MKRLFILRHAKSSWDAKGLDDHERPLNGRGRHAAALMGAVMAERGYRPDGILCSSSVRTRETLELLRPHIGTRVPVLIERELYHASAQRLLARLHRLPDGWDSALLIGHNPGLEQLVLLLPDPTGPRLAPVKFPTAALAVLDFPVTAWSRVEAGAGELADFVAPREIGG